MAEALQAETVDQVLAGLRFGQPLHLHDTIGSTNDEAKALAAAGGPEGLLVLAETQTAGRGRAGRRWLTPPGTALALSLVLRPALPAAQATRLGMLAGVGVCEAIEQVAGVRAALKWPNDILVGGRKAGGILVEAGLDGDRLEYAVVGIGLNVSAAPPRAEVDFPATALDAEAGRAVKREELLRAILERLDAHYPEVTGAPANRLHAAWSARLLWLGERITAYTLAGEYHGQAESVDADGALLIRLDSGEPVRLTAGDVRLRPAAV